MVDQQINAPRKMSDGGGLFTRQPRDAVCAKVAKSAAIVYFIEEAEELNAAAIHETIADVFWPEFCRLFDVEVSS